MHPVLFQFEWLGETRTVWAYGSALLVGGIVFCFSALLVGRWRGVPRGTVLACLLIVAPSLLLGSRLLFYATNLTLYRPSARHPLRVIAADFSLFGGLILAAAVVVVVARARKWNAWAIADVLTPGAALGIAVARVGCFLNGCCTGVASDLPWAVTYPAGGMAHLHQAAADVSVLVMGPQAVHPTQLYEVAAALAGAALGIWLIRRKAPLGVSFLAVGAWYCAFRFVNDCFRPVGPTLNVPQWFFPALHVLLAVVCGTALGLRWWEWANEGQKG